MDYYIYYRVPCRFESPMRQRVETLQEFLARQFGIAPLLRRRAEATEEQQTWMEVYSGIPASLVAQFESALAAAVEQFELQEMIDGPRHLECFMEFSSCA